MTTALGEGDQLAYDNAVFIISNDKSLPKNPINIARPAQFLIQVRSETIQMEIMRVCGDALMQAAQGVL